MTTVPEDSADVQSEPVDTAQTAAPRKPAAKKAAARPASNGAAQVLVVGAGPTGLVLALWLTHLGVRVRILDKLMQSGTTSRALAVQGRTLELYRQIGLADAVLEAGHRVAAVNLWVKGEKKLRVGLQDIGEGLGPFPDPIIFPQDQHEALLIDKLKSLGVEVERGYELIDFDDGAHGITARFKSQNDEIVSIAADWIAGCDGARSAVRHRVGVGFRGGEYARLAMSLTRRSAARWATANSTSPWTPQTSSLFSP